MSICLDRLRDIEAAVEKTEQEAEAEATRHQPLFEAFRAVREATPAELGVTGPAFYREWAERFCRAGTELVAAGLSVWLAGRVTTTDSAEALAVEIYQLGAEGKKEAIVRLLTETFHLAKTDADNQTKIRSRSAVNAWLRRRLAEKLWDWLAHRPETGTVTCSQTALGESSEPKAASEGASQVGDPLASKTPAVSMIDLVSAIHSQHPALPKLRAVPNETTEQPVLDALYRLGAIGLGGLKNIPREKRPTGERLAPIAIGRACDGQFKATLAHMVDLGWLDNGRNHRVGSGYFLTEAGVALVTERPRCETPLR